MSTFVINGETEVSNELAMALYNSMPEIGRQGVAQVFAARLMSGPLSVKAIETAARVYMEKAKIPQAGALALRAGVAEKCKEFGKQSMNQDVVRGIVEDETRKAAAEFAKSHVQNLMSAIPLEALIAAATPVVVDVIRALAQKYFTNTQEGQNWVLGLISAVKAAEEETMQEVMTERLRAAAEPIIQEAERAVRLNAEKLKRRNSENNGLDVAVGRQII